MLDKVKEFSPVSDWKTAIGFVVLVAVAVFLLKKIPGLPTALKP